jgi:hypothetical protein
MSLPVVASRIQNRRGTQSQFNGPTGIYPQDYNGIGGYNSIPGFTPENYPEVLLPGEIGFCTDTRKIYIGNINGEFVEVDSGQSTLTSLSILPLNIDLPPSAVFTPMPELSYEATAFMSIIYSIRDNSSPDWNTVGTTFSRNATLKITAISNFVDLNNDPYPPISPIELVDDGVESNSTSYYLSFKAEYSGSLIQISYTHNFPSTLKFSSSTITWLPY